MTIKIYNPAMDRMEEATQESIDKIVNGNLKLAKQRNIIKAIANLNIINDDSKLTSIQKHLDSIGILV